jgi:hypothetical protein
MEPHETRAPMEPVRCEGPDGRVRTNYAVMTRLSYEPTAQTVAGPSAGLDGQGMTTQATI